MMWQSYSDGKRSKSQKSGVGVRGWVEIELPFRTTGFAMTKWGLKFIMIRDEKMWKWESASRSVVSDSLWRHRTYPTRLLCPWHSPGKNTGVDCHPLLQRIFLTQELNPGLLHCRQILYYLNHKGSPVSITEVPFRACFLAMHILWKTTFVHALVFSCVIINSIITLIIYPYRHTYVYNFFLFSLHLCRRQISVMETLLMIRNKQGKTRHLKNS